MKKNIPTIDPALADDVVHAIVQRLVARGVLDPKGKKDEDFLREACKLLRSEKFEWGFVVDHRTPLLKQAREFRKSGDENLACVLYATWIEHFLNALIADLAARKGMTQIEIAAIIRESQIRAKTSWVLHLLGTKGIGETQRRRIETISNLRNEFVHYKWQVENEQSGETKEKCLQEVEKTVAYLLHFENRVLFGHHKRRVQSAIKRPRKHYRSKKGSEGEKRIL